MLNRLNDRQRQLVADNHNLIYKFLSLRNLDVNDIEDWYGVAATGLCKAGIIFDSTRGVRFSSLAFICMENEVRREFRRIYKHEIPDVISLECTVIGTNDITLGELIPDSTDYEEMVDFNDAMCRALDEMSDKGRDIVNKIIAGAEKTEVARLFGISRTAVYNTYHSFIRKLKKYLEIDITD